MPINTTARGQTPGDEGLLFLTTGSMEGEKKQALLPSSSSYQLDVSNTKKPKEKHESISVLRELQKHLLLTLLKVCHTFLIIFTRIHVRAAPNVLLPNVSHRFSWEN